MPQSQSADDAARHFRQQPWCARILDAPGTKYCLPSARVDRDGSDTDTPAGRIQSQDQLFYRALNSDEGVPRMLAVYTDPDAAPGASPEASPAASSQRGDGLRFAISAVSLLLELRDHVRGFNGYAHGGFLGAVMDEAMGTLIFTNYEYQAAKDAEAEAAASPSPSPGWQVPPGVVDMKVGGLTMTAFMHVAFRRPVSTPSTVLATAALNRIEGRKIFIDVAVRDAEGAVCATCEGMWVSMNPLAGGGAKL